jgi:hypothetical protein
MIVLAVVLLTLLLAALGILAVVVSPLFFAGMILVFVAMGYAGVKSTLPGRKRTASIGRADETAF